MKPFYFNTELGPLFNQEIINFLTHTGKWSLSFDHLYFDLNELKDSSDSGLILLSYSHTRKAEVNDDFSKLNSFATLIGNIVLKNQKELNIKNFMLGRFLWNYYNKASSGVYHTDSTEDMEGHYLSIVYYLNSNDGGTEIDGIKYSSRPGHALIFPSNCKHRGFGPYASKNKWVLNIMAKIELNDVV